MVSASCTAAHRRISGPQAGRRSDAYLPASVPQEPSLQLTVLDPAEQQQVVGEFNAARDAEYAEVLERLPAFREELDLERARGRVTYAEVEESEADLERFRAWLAKIAARDYFAAPVGPAARAAVQDAAADLAAFEQAALATEAPEPGANPPNPAARRRA